MKNVIVATLLLIFLLCRMPTAMADEWQARDLIVWGGAKFKLPQQPLEPLLQDLEMANPLLLRSQGSGTNRGYVAEWLITRNTLCYNGLTGRYDANEKEIASKAGFDRLPVVANWYSGTLQLPVGEFDIRTQCWPVVIELKFKHGMLVKTLLRKDQVEIFPGYQDTKDTKGSKDTKGNF